MFPLLHGRRWWHFRRFEGLLLSLACMFLLNIIFPGKIYGGTAQACYLPLQLLAGINLYGRLRPGFWAAALTAAGILALHPFQALSSMPRALQFSLLLLHGLFFFIILLEVFIQLYRAQTHRLHLDARQTLCAGLSGLLLIGYSGFFLFLLLENFQPGSFRRREPAGSFLLQLHQPHDHRLRRHNARLLGRAQCHRAGVPVRQHLLAGGHRLHRGPHLCQPPRPEGG